MKCEICHKEFESTSALAGHLAVHRIQAKTYYDKYLLKDGDGKCKMCGKPTRFKGLTGYSVYCSSKCVWSDRVNIDNRNLTNSNKSKEELEVSNERRRATRKANIERTRQNRHDKSFEKLKSKLAEHSLELVDTEIVDNAIRRLIIKCLDCGNVLCLDRSGIDRRIRNGSFAICDKCAPVFHSGIETEFVNWLRTVYSGEIQMNVRGLIKNNMEIDVYLPEMKLGIEIDGLHWHCEDNVDKKYHLRKTRFSEDAGIRLIHITDHEWNNKKEIVQSRIRAIIGKSERIYARKCQIVKLDSKECEEFLNSSHIQGSCVSKYRYGLLYRDELVAVMTFGKSRFEDAVELLRYANKAEKTVIGGAGKLLKHFIEDVKPSSIVSYADRRWSAGNLYYKLGFEHVSDTVPNYFYYKNGKLETRMKFQKWKLVKEGFDNSKTEYEIMRERGYRRFYDCGNMKFVLKLK